VTNNKLAKWSVWLGLILLLWPLSVRAQTAPLSDLDALRYIASQPDLIAAFGPDASKGRSHYETWGIKEGRKITFEPLNYTASHPDLIAAFGIDEIKAVTHYIQWGFKEGRQITFDPASYLALHADLRQAYGTDLKAAASHYIRFGYAEGRATQGAPIFQSSASSLVFDNQLASSTKTLTITNAGTVSLTVTSVTLAGNDADRFTQKNNCSSLAAAASCSVDITYTPKGTTESSASLRVVTNASGSPHVISLLGKLVPLSDLDALRYIASHPDLIAAFGADAAKGRSHYETWGIKEGRKITFVPLNYTASHSDLIAAFGVDETKAVTHYIQAGFKEGRKVTFDPAVYLALHSDLRVAFGTDLAASAIHYIQWGYKEGRATAGTLAIRLSTTTLSFANQAINTASIVQRITVSNSGTIPLTINAISVTGSGAAEFSQSSDCSTVSVGESCTINITFAPKSAGLKSAVVSISHNAPGSPSEVVLSGTGVTASTSGLSDLDALRYIASHPDLIAAFGSDAAKGRSHYEQWGIKEGRKITFVPLNYTASHPDLIAAFGVDETKAVSHYIQAGFKEERKVTFDPSVYLALYADLRAAFGTDLVAAAKHYIQSGYKEGRATTGQPVLQVSPSSVSFGSVTQGTSSPVRTVIVANTGNLPLGVSQISLIGTNRDQFSQTNNCSSVAAGSSCTISVTFTPTITGGKSASISITHNASGSPSSVTLSGTGATAPTPTISINPTSLSFSQTVNTTSSAQAITVSNTGNATLTVSGVSLGGADASHFAQTNNCSSVAAGSSCTINVTFRPTSAGSKSASVSIAHNASGSPTGISLSGTALSAVAIASVQSLECVRVNTGALIPCESSSIEQGTRVHITIQNTGSATLNFSGSPSVSGGNALSVAGSSNAFTIGAGSTGRLIFDVIVSATTCQRYTINWPHNGSNSPLLYAFNLGPCASVTTPAISVNPGSLSFSQTINTTSSAQAITVRNTGNATLTISGVSLGGADASQFAQTNTCSSVAAGSSCTISVTFRLTSAGSKSASISIAHNASGSPSSVSLTGTGAAAGLSMNDLALTLNVLGFSESKATGTVSATGSTSTPVMYSIQTQGAYGVASINSTTGAVTYTVSDLLSSATTTSDRVTVKATAGSDTVTANVNIALRYDPLLPHQWHLRNTGQYAFSDIRPTPGFDINVASAWAQGYSGLGIKVGVVDSGLEIGHEDLSANVDAANSINFIDNGTNPSPSAGDDHGTKVAGIIGAMGFNGKGGRGVAYRAQLRGYNWLATTSTGSADNFARSFGQDDRSRGNDIFNGSFGGDETTSGNVIHYSLPSFSNTRSTVLNQTNALRGGKGAVVVMSAGNNFADNKLSGACANAVSFGVSCSLPATGSYKQSIVPIIVGALGADGKKASYSNAASSLWVSAPGGEDGYEAIFTGTSPRVEYFEPAITTTTTTGCAKYTARFNELDKLGGNSLSTQCQYTAIMNGTSSAAPMVSGVAALMLEANPNLGYRDVAHILAVTAKKVDPSFSGVTANLVGATRQLEQGWTTNAAGYAFSNRYGFGAVDAGAAVSMARTYTSYLPSMRIVGAPPVQPASINIGPNGQSVTFVINDNVTKTEKVYLLVDIYMREWNFTGPAWAYCTQVELTSPSGTKSIVFNAANGFQNKRLERVLLSSNAFYGENPNGSWRMTAFDWCSPAPATPAGFSVSNPQEFVLTGY
jgi:subtilisin family serine protease